ncbi:hypothetical protein O6H91_Y119200 [Diphasiastrum complanatum]|nr:hypothetical protein O6H91_Y119200 [Diphasiastrum complanatum]
MKDSVPSQGSDRLAPMEGLAETGGEEAVGKVAKLASVLPRVLIVSRRSVRKNKFVDFVGEYHLDLIVSYGAVPVIVPRVSGLHSLLDSFEPIHGVLLCEGEDIDPTLYDSDFSSFTSEEIEEIKQAHSSDTLVDRYKDSIELQLARRCLERNIPYLGICRGSQVLNVACGGSLYQDVERELSKGGGTQIRHINYDDYDGHRHAVKIVPGTPLYEWFSHENFEQMELLVNSYHHQGIKRLSERFIPMAFAPDGLVEAFYDPDVYNPEEGKFIVGLQFHPERMRHEQDSNRSKDCSASFEGDFDYPGCPRAYQEFVKAVLAYKRKLLASENKGLQKLDGVMENQRQKLIRSFSAAKHMYEEQAHVRKCPSSHGSTKALNALTRQSYEKSSRELELGAEFLQVNTEMSMQQVINRLKQIGATVRDSSILLQKLLLNEQLRNSAKMLIEGLETSKLHDLQEFYTMMAEVASDVLEKRKSEL